MADRMAWFLTSTGKKFSLGCMCTASIGAFAVQYFPQTFLLNKYKEIVSMYESALPVPLHKRVRQRWDEAIKDLNIAEHEVKYLEPFTVFGFELFRAGSVSGKWGAIIGIPINFTYTDVATANKERIQVNNEPVNWNREDAKKLIESLILSDDAQRYGIAKEILMTRTHEPLIVPIISSLIVSTTYIMSRSLNEKYKLLEKPFLLRGSVYMAICAFGYAAWAIQKDVLVTMWERGADEHIAQLDKSYSRGAVEFWDKTLQRNRALRTLLGPDGENVFTPAGNTKHWFRQPSIPISERKTFFQDNLAGRKRGEETLDEEVEKTMPA